MALNPTDQSLLKLLSRTGVLLFPGPEREGEPWFPKRSKTALAVAQPMVLTHHAKWVAESLLSAGVVKWTTVNVEPASISRRNGGRSIRGIWKKYNKYVNSISIFVTNIINFLSSDKERFLLCLEFSTSLGGGHPFSFTFSWILILLPKRGWFWTDAEFDCTPIKVEDCQFPDHAQETDQYFMISFLPRYFTGQPSSTWPHPFFCYCLEDSHSIHFPAQFTSSDTADTHWV